VSVLNVGKGSNKILTMLALTVNKARAKLRPETLPLVRRAAGQPHAALQFTSTLTLQCWRQNPQKEVGVISVTWNLPSNFARPQVGGNGGLIDTVSPAHYFAASDSIP
jgi:hypothetical protein